MHNLPSLNADITTPFVNGPVTTCNCLPAHTRAFGRCVVLHTNTSENTRPWLSVKNRWRRLDLLQPLVDRERAQTPGEQWA